jgi:serine/threonine protein kinase
VKAVCPACETETEVPSPTTALINCGQCRVRFLPPDATEVSIVAPAGETEVQQIQQIELPESFRKRYQIVQLLGNGGLGTVYLARSLASGEQVAVKFLHAVDVPDVLARFMREGRLMAEIRHPNVARVYEIGELGTHPWLALEYIAGGSLRQRLDKIGRLTVSESVRILTDVLAGLGACHARGIIHRDVKPENILLTGDGRAVVADLGIAKNITAGVQSVVTVVGAVVGSPRYMSPEQCLFETAGITTDLYSAGVVLYEMLSGKPPFAMENPFQLMKCHIEVDPRPIQELVAGIPERVATAVAKALAKKPDARPATAAAFIAELGGGEPSARTSAFSGLKTRKVKALAIDSSGSRKLGELARAAEARPRAAQASVLTSGKIRVVAPEPPAGAESGKLWMAALAGAVAMAVALVAILGIYHYMDRNRRPPTGDRPVHSS